MTAKRNRLKLDKAKGAIFVYQSKHLQDVTNADDDAIRARLEFDDADLFDGCA